MPSSSRKRARATALAALLLRAGASHAGPDVPDGVVLQGVYDGDVWRNAHGGRARGTVYAAHLDTSLALDAGKLWGWEGTRFYLRSFADNGAGIARLAGSAMGPDNWEAADAGARLLEAWAERALFSRRLSVRAGLYDTTTEFDKNKSQVLFMTLTDIGFWSARPQDKVGIGMVYGASGAPFRRAQAAQDLPTRPNEWVVEATWRAPLTAWLAVQPDVQWIRNPTYAPRHRSALVWGLRFELTAGVGGG